jgi:cytosine/adenosine deaminase-related metal-dependent hydrolase
MFTEMRLALASQNAMRMARRDRGEQNLPKRLTVRDALEFATVEGAKANGLEGKVGSLAPGKQADIVLLRKDRINVMPVNDAIGAVVLGMDTSNVDAVFVAGQAKKLNGHLVGVDLKRIADLATKSRDYLAAKAKAG